MHHAKTSPIPNLPSGPLRVAGWTFFQGLDSAGQDLRAIPHLADDPTALVNVASTTPDCIAFNTNGFLKHTLAPLRSWIRWTADLCRGMYVRDGVLVGLATNLLRVCTGTNGSPGAGPDAVGDAVRSGGSESSCSASGGNPAGSTGIVPLE